WLEATGGEVSVSSYAMIGSDLLHMFLILQYILITLTAVTLSSDTITREVDRGTLGLIALTPTTPWRIVLAKWKGCVAQVGLLALCGIPIVGMCVYLGSIGPGQLLAVAALTLSCGALAAAVGIASSALSATGWVALLKGLLLMAVWWWVPPGLAVLFGYPAAFLWVHPAAVPGMGVEPVPCLFASLVTFGTSFLLLAYAARRIPGLATTVPRVRAAKRFWFRMFFEGAVTRLASRRRSRSAPRRRSNPVLWKEVSFGKKCIPRYEAWAAVFFASGVMVLMPYFTVFTLASLLLIVVAGTGAALFVREREGKYWELLLSTPLSSSSILWGKLGGGALSLVPALICVVLIVVFSGMMMTRSFFGAAVTAGVVFSFVAFIYAASAVCSMHAKTVRGSFGLSMMLVVLFLGVPPAAFALTDWAGLRAVASFLSPVLQVLQLGGAGEGNPLAGAADGTLSGYPVLFIVFYTILALECIGWILWTLHRRTQRDI
ncbi:MAG: ABC transporter permease, partial [Planctomycetota bacterium]